MTSRAALRHCPWPAALILLLFVGPAPAANGAAPPEIEDYNEIQEHLIEPHPVVVTPWADESEDRENLSWTFELTVDERGTVSAAQLKSGPREFRENANRTARTVRFKPFHRNGQPVPVRLKLSLWSRSTDYSGPEDRAFPATLDPSTAVIALRRTSCYGTCPSYRVELRGNGEVHYRGDSDVLVRGSHRWRIDPAKITPLLEMFRRANYFTLAGYYEYPVTDLPTYISRFSVGDRNKFVLNYGGSFGRAFASTRMPGEDPDMPPVVMEIEDAIDQISGAASYVSGDETTLQKLRDERWNFRSRDAGEGLRMLLSDCKTTLAREFIRAGAPVNVYGEGFGAGLPVAYATRCGDIDLVRLMLAQGALQDRGDAKTFLWSSVGSGHPAIVALALKHYGNVNAKDEDGASLLALAAGSFAEDDYPNAATFDSVKVVEMLIDAGADLNARDEDGKTPIFEANDAPVVAALVRRGADPNARDSGGQTALFDRYFAEPKSALVAAGADVNARDKLGRTALFTQENPDSIKVLLDAGADIDAVDLEGRSAIEQMRSESGTTALLAAGAKLPSDPTRMNAMIARATDKKWTELLPLLEAAAKGR